MNLQQLYYFKKLAEEKQFTKAAQALYISQPSLSKSIKNLEDSLGVQLFTQSGRSTVLTDEGKIFYEHISLALAEIQKAQDLIDEYKGSLHGEINIGCIPTLISSYVAELIDEFERRTNSHIRTHIFQGFSPRVIHGVEKGIYDIGLCYVPEELGNFNKTIISYQHLCLGVTRNNAKYAGRKTISLEELRQSDEKFISYRTDNYAGIDVQKFLRPYHLNVEYDYDDENYMCTSIVRQDKTALLFDVPDIKKYREIRLIPIIECPPDFHPIYLIYTDKPKSRSVEYLINFIKETEEK